MESTCSDQIKSAVDQLQPFPSVATKLLQSCQDANQDVNELVRFIECDSVIASKVLACANSPLYGYARQINSVPHAVVVLGFRNVSQLALSFATQDIFEHQPDQYEFRKRLFQHSLGCGLLARVLAGSLNDVDPDLAYLTGMLHDFGKLVLLDVAGATYACELAEKDARQRLEMETNWFGTSHAQIGLQCAEKWGLPVELCTAIGFHHAPDDSPEFQSLARLIEQANQLSKHFGWGSGCAGEPIRTIEEIFADSGLESKIESIRAEVQSEFDALVSVSQ